MPELKDSVKKAIDNLRKQPKLIYCPVVRADIVFIIRGYGFKQRSGNYADYELAKKKIFKYGCLDNDDYEMIVRWISEYLGI